MTELLPHHAGMFTKILYEKGPKELAKYLANNEPHRLALERTLTDIMNHRQDESIILAAGQNDVLCEDCPGQHGSYRLPGLGVVHDRCNLTRPEALKTEQEVTQRLRKLTGKENPTVREIYRASCEEWEALKS